MLIRPSLDPGKSVPNRFRATVVARDPSVTDLRSTNSKRRILREQVEFPATRLEPGPRGARFHVVDFDASQKLLREPAALIQASSDLPFGWNFIDGFTNLDDDALVNSAAFRAQNVYAIAARTLALFEFALGRPVPWAFPSPHLYLVPTAFEEANAYYSDTDQAPLVRLLSLEEHANRLHLPGP